MKNKLWSRGLSVVLALALCAGLWFPAGAETAPVDRTARYVMNTVQTPAAGNIGGEWAALGLARWGGEAPAGWFEIYYQAVEAHVKETAGILHKKKYTEYSRTVVALTAMGKDPRNVAGYDLLRPLGDYEKVLWQGINGPIWALIALDSGDYEVPENTEAATQATRQLYVDELLRKQLPSGGWALSGTEPDADITALALQALAHYTGQSTVQTAVDNALTWLSAAQNKEDGTYQSYGTASAESCAQVAVALCALGIDPAEDARFAKNSRTVEDALLSFQKADGSFHHVMTDDGNQMATEQGFYALVALQRLRDGRPALYTMTDRPGGPDVPKGLDNKDPEVQGRPLVSPNIDFSDLSGHSDREAILALARRGIINGTGDGTFAPEGNMTRAAFAAIITRGLGLSGKETGDFSDVPAGSWYASPVGKAAEKGIVQGVGGGKFNPVGTITRQEAAVMLSRAAVLCGLDTGMTEEEVSAALAQFGDGDSVASWARSSLAWCADNGLTQGWETLEPTTPILRAEVARMLAVLLKNAALLG